MSTFAEFHPVVLLVYYLAVLVVTMFTMQPVLLALSFTGAFLFYAAQNTPRKWGGDFVYYFFLFVLIAVTNPLFTHNGKTILFFMNDNPVTLEAFWFGMAAALMIVAVIFWCKAYYTVMTTDKFIYLFGRTMPKISLLISMSVRFFPLLTRQMKKVRQAQRAMGLYASDSLIDRLLFELRVFDSLLGWMLENSVDTADSMKARGYGLRGRSRFSIFVFTHRDAVLLVITGTLFAGTLAGFCTGVFDFSYYPTVSGVKGGATAVCMSVFAAILLLLPFLIETSGNVYWKLRINQKSV